jgi:hypothetical protein
LLEAQRAHGSSHPSGCRLSAPPHAASDASKWASSWR